MRKYKKNDKCQVWRLVQKYNFTTCINDQSHRRISPIKTTTFIGATDTPYQDAGRGGLQRFKTPPAPLGQSLALRVQQVKHILS